MYEVDEWIGENRRTERREATGTDLVRPRPFAPRSSSRRLRPMRFPPVGRCTSMKQRHPYALGLLLTVGLVVFSVPAQAAARGHQATPKSPKASVTWITGASFPFEAYRWDGALYQPNNR